MAAKKNPLSDKAYELYKSGMKLVDIATQLNCSDATIRTWKNRYKWDDNASETFQKKNETQRNVSKNKDKTTEKKLTPKQEAFQAEFIGNGGNATQAAKNAGYAESGARVQGHRLLSSYDWWQGKTYKIHGSEPGFPNLLESTGYNIDFEAKRGVCVNMLGFHGYNCRHSHGPWYKELGDRAFPKLDKEESQKRYDLEQKQRYFERAVRKTKRLLLIKEQELKAFPDNPDIQSEYDKLSYKLRMQNRQ